jgi:hypothetical protein
MNDDIDIYILVTPSEEDKTKEEFRVTCLDSSNDITRTLHQGFFPEDINPSEVKCHFNGRTIFTDEFAAKEEAYRIASSNHATDAPVYHMYIETPFVKWGETDHGKAKKNQG